MPNYCSTAASQRSHAPLGLCDSTWPEVDRHARRALLVPLGSLEQHGPHLPLDADTRIAVAVARAVAARREGIAVSPPVAIGASGEHAAFPGTLSIGTHALAELLVELGRHAAHDWAALLLVNAHGGNGDAVASAVARLGGEGHRCAAFHVTADGEDAHAGHAETALLLHLDPAAIRMELLQAGECRPLSELMDRLRRDGVRAVSRNGVLGDPRGATAADGEWLLDEISASCLAALDAVLAPRAPDG